jgi:hypothetical protein
MPEGTTMVTEVFVAKELLFLTTKVVARQVKVITE